MTMKIIVYVIIVYHENGENTIYDLHFLANSVK